MKKCSLCQTLKELNCFNKNKSKKDGLNNICRTCSHERSRRYYAENKEKHKNVVRKRSRTLRTKIYEEINTFKSFKGCCVCSEKESVCLDFHHLDPKEKDNNISTLITFENIRKVREEMTKCIVICSNCHRKLHAGLIIL